GRSAFSQKLAKLSEALFRNDDSALELRHLEKHFLVDERETVTVRRGHAHHAVFKVLKENAIEVIAGGIGRDRELSAVDHVGQCFDPGFEISLVFERGERGIFVSCKAYDIEAGLSANEFNPVVLFAGDVEFLGGKLLDDIQEVFSGESDLSF